MKHTIKYTLAVCAMAAAVILPLAAATKTISVFGTAKTQGKLCIEVVDGKSEKPVEGATVVIPEIDASYQTGSDGKTAIIDVPVLENKHFSSIQQMPWGEVTVLVYKDGYIPYALFHTQVWQSQLRNGPRIYLFIDDGSTSGDAFSVIEGPQRLWVNELVEKYRPAQ